MSIARPAAAHAASTSATSADVTAADHYAARLTAHPELTPEDRGLSAADVDDALAARIDRMRDVAQSLAAAQDTRLTGLRDDDLTALELRAALVALCVLLALVVAARTTRSITRRRSRSPATARAKVVLPAPGVAVTRKSRRPGSACAVW